VSLAELLPAIRSLPRSEQVELLHLLIDGVAQPASPDDGIPESLRELLPPPGSVIPQVSPVFTDAAGLRVLEAVLAEGKGTV
jgi:hypothetical protein